MTLHQSRYNTAMTLCARWEGTATNGQLLSKLNQLRFEHTVVINLVIQSALESIHSQMPRTKPTPHPYKHSHTQNYDEIKLIVISPNLPVHSLLGTTFHWLPERHLMDVKFDTGL